MTLEEMQARIIDLEKRLDDLAGKELPEEVTPATADRLLRVEKGTTLAAIRRGDLKAAKRPGAKRYRVLRSDLEAWRMSW